MIKLDCSATELLEHFQAGVLYADVIGEIEPVTDLVHLLLSYRIRSVTYYLYQA